MPILNYAFGGSYAHLCNIWISPAVLVSSFTLNVSLACLFMYALRIFTSCMFRLCLSLDHVSPTMLDTNGLDEGGPV